MADLAAPTLQFDSSCECARREVALPRTLPAIGDDFDWMVRDFEGFTRFMREDLEARVPERRRWTAADLEIVLVEAFAAVLDQLSDMLDRVAAEATLETARRPESVRRLLALIGHDALHEAHVRNPEIETSEHLERLWEREPERMEEARRAGPRAVHAQRRMVSLEDYAVRLEEHPLVNRARAALAWGGSWPVVQLAVTLDNDRSLDADPFTGLDPGEAQRLKDKVAKFHAERGLPPLEEFPAEGGFRMLLQSYLEAYRMLGQEVRLQDATIVGIELALSIRLRANYFQSEVRREIERVLGRGPDGFFRPGRLRFGEDLHSADIIQAVMGIDGVETVCVNRFKRLGPQFADESQSGRIVLSGLEIAVCDNDPRNEKRHRGYFRLSLHAGRAG
ncbi:MAG: hypothetical protein AABM64_06640 [Pseudomonadota bacterium]